MFCVSPTWLWEFQVGHCWMCFSYFYFTVFETTTGWSNVSNVQTFFFRFWWKHPYKIMFLSKLSKLNPYWFMSKATYFLFSWNHGDIMLKPTQKEPSWSCVFHLIIYFPHFFFSAISQTCFHVRRKLVLDNYSISQVLF